MSDQKQTKRLSSFKYYSLLTEVDLWIINQAITDVSLAVQECDVIT